jgi:DHA1 family inner membrane transport protein
MAAIHVAFAELSSSAPAAILLVFMWGVITFVIVPPMQMRVVETASEAPNLAATLNQGAFNAGNAAGAWAGGAAISMGVSYADLPFVGAAIALSAFGVALISFALDRRDAIQQPA